MFQNIYLSLSMVVGTGFELEVEGTEALNDPLDYLGTVIWASYVKA